MPVNTVRQDYEDMKAKWKRLRDCSGGRDAIIKAGNLYVPDLPGADTVGNAAYRTRGNFYNAVMRTVQGMNGSIFQEPPEVEFPTAFEDFLTDITLTGVTFEMFSSEAGREVVLLARYGVMVDLPDVLATDTRPYICGYKAEDIINWRVQRMDGDEVLTMVVLKETAEIPNPEDMFVCKVIPQIRVIFLKEGKCTGQLWREKTDMSHQWELVVDSEKTLMRRGVALDFIPFVFIGAIHSTPDIEDPPLIDMADVNLGHWRNSVDHEHGLHLVALPTPWVSGPKGQNTGPMKIGPSQVWELELQGSAGMLEFNGTGLGSLVIAMDEKKKQMASLGARLLEDAPATAETASAVRMRHSGEHASLRTIAGSIEQGFTLVLQMVAWWAGTDATPNDVEANVELNKEYLDIKATPQEVQVALTALQAGEISFETWWQILSDGGWAREGIDAKAERKEIDKDKALEPEPPINPELSPGEVVPKPGEPGYVPPKKPGEPGYVPKPGEPGYKPPAAA